MPEYVFKMKPLPKPEYRLMKSLMNQLAIDSPSELFAVLCRLAREVGHYSPQAQTGSAAAQPSDRKFGEVWISQVIDSYRSMTEAERQAEYTDTPIGQ